ncbi:MAG: YdcH family protein [Gammaproteobacteria bacterium]|uniref:GTP-binding protein n=1 Tax=Sulfuricella denitrificans (strain DSM 22764 / NBRC 105220 / skB26) TaxID=1163617 RepID=S6AJK5_SULDS|nr:YdcH family protein [Sulfuricella denitrificans]MBU1690305.1 YdcH family protein [Gammaproteobacteria bacterium]MBU1980193.1 YdcH family protein [Gammaproteobacteria bacterium]BAN34704.1 hypothetical protein SCD_n00863 [Sulfuricella denitrificans skB26]
MQVDHHDLAHEFPEFKDEIYKLKISSTHFARLFDEYERTEREVHRIEVEDVPVSDILIEDLKKKRLHLKDEIYALLRNGGVPAH